MAQEPVLLVVYLTNKHVEGYYFMVSGAENMDTSI